MTKTKVTDHRRSSAPEPKSVETGSVVVYSWSSDPPGTVNPTPMEVRLRLVVRDEQGDLGVVLPMTTAKDVDSLIEALRLERDRVWPRPN